MNSFGRIFRLSIFGESHGKSIGVTIDGAPAGIAFCEEDMFNDLQRRKAGAKGTTPRVESDAPKIISGVFNGKTTGAPLTILFENSNSISKDYNQFMAHPRPGHTDFVSQMKFNGFADNRGGGHFSGRLTLALVAAGALAKQIIAPIIITATVTEAGGDSNVTAAVDKALLEKDSIGALISCTAKQMPIGLGEPFFDALESKISQMIFAIPAIKGIEFGSGFAAATMSGSEHNDLILDASGKTETNFSGGINGGISNGNDLFFRVAVKPTSSIGLPQKTFNFEHGQVEDLTIGGRHDSCIALRIIPVIEAATAIVLADFMLLR